nr:ATP-binding cassette sub- A member 1 [Polyrhizophydium stewartii]
MFTPATAATQSYMSTFAALNAKRTGETALALEGAWSDLAAIPSRNLDMVPVGSPDFIYNYALRHPNVTAWGITFNQATTNGVNNVQYQIWYNSTRVANSSDVFGRQLVAFMRGLDEAIITVLNDPSATVKASIDVTVRDWPVVPPKTLSDSIVQNLGPVFFFSCVMVIFINVVNQILTEKEQKLRHGMEMMGLRPIVYWLSMFLSTSLLVLASSVVTCILGIAFQFATFKNGNFAVLLVTFFLLGEAMIVFAFFITTLVRRARVGILAGIFVFIIGLLFESFVFSSGFVGYIWWKPTTPSAAPIVLSLLPFFNFGKCFLDISTLTTGKLDELTGTYVPGPGFSWSSIYSPVISTLLPTYSDATQPDVPALVVSWYMLLVDMAVYGVLTWYLDRVIPDEFGAALPLWFPFMPTFWGIESRRQRSVEREDWLDEVMSTSAREKIDDEDSDVSVERSRALSAAFWPAAKIVHLRKVYSSLLGKEEKIAIKDSCFTLEEGKLLALLGQNGAGKSTTMNILSGLTPATSGDAYIYGMSVRHQMHRIRKVMGVCPQHDILFGDLTAREHIYLYAGLKGVPRAEWAALVEDRLQAVRLLKVADQRAKTFSGGMKRRLSVVISTIGDPQIVFLDEPTTGMDPVNRRHVWSFIEQFKQGRIVVLTTHSMEEADVLGDRIAIMAHGRLRAIGNSVTLKNKFGAGYRISIVTDPARSDEVRAIVYTQVPGATLEDDSAGSLIYQFPVSSTPLIPAFVRNLNNYEGLIKAWGISQTTLEEVFLKIIRDANPGGYAADQLVVLDDAAPLPGTLRPRFSVRRRNTTRSQSAAAAAANAAAADKDVYTDAAPTSSSTNASSRNNSSLNPLV